MFDIVKVGKKIAELRKANNMTQFDFADKLGISFQAVSNWERGNSMPDISKLPEIAELFNVSIDEILGKENSVLNEVVNGEKVNLNHHSESEVDEAAALMNSQQIKEMIDVSNCHPKMISAVLPFLDRNYIEELADRFMDAGQSIAVFLPFLSTKRIDALAEKASAKGEFCNNFLPFMSGEKIKTIANEAFDKGGLEAVKPYLPFMKQKDIQNLVEKIFTQNQ